MRALGVDPGTRTVGFGVVEASGGGYRVLAQGVLRLGQSGHPMGERLRDLYAGLQRLLQEWHPEELAVEEPFVARNPRGALALGQALGVVRLAAAVEGISLVSYTPTQIKEVITGYGRGGKAQVQQMVRLQLGFAGGHLAADAADALAVALCHLHLQGVARRLGQAQGAAL